MVARKTEGCVYGPPVQGKAMAETKQMIIGDCSHLPFSRAEAVRLRVLGEEVETKLPFDPSHPEKVFLRSLAGRPILDWPVALPPRDPRGVESAETFECWKNASASKVGIAGSYFSFKAGGRTALHSHLEARLLRYFEMCPFVAEIRTQYPAWDREKYLWCSERGNRMRKSDVMTVDFMLTLQIPGHPFRVYHGVSGKPAALVGNEKVVSRHGREEDTLWKWRCTHEVMTEETIGEIEFSNYRRLFALMLHVEDIGAHAPAAEQLAHVLYETNARGSLNRVLGMVAKRLGWSLAHGYLLFGIGHFLGYLRWDHRFLLARRLPMMLNKR
ncbi:hypothetical protein PQR65_13395 [Paraburkholderia nemoris]|uniref:hypothetical protein n=1 Tax=Paraburkholderia nemoris TaxID=2793076 RepID=UPI0038BCC1EF